VARALRIFCAIPESANNGALPGSNVWYRNLVEPLLDMGHDVVQPSFSVGDHYRATYAHGTDQQKKARDLYGQRLVEDVRRTHSEKPLDLVLTYYDSFQLSIEAVTELRAVVSPVVNYWSNATHQFDDIKEIAPHFDYCLVTERRALEKYRNIAARTVRWQMAANPNFYRPHRVARVFDLTFIGQKYFNRPEYLRHLSDGGIRLKVFGPSWFALTPLFGGGSIFESLRRFPGRMLLRHKQRVAWERMLKADPLTLPLNAYRGIPSDEDMVKIHCRSNVCLNLSDVYDETTGKTDRFIKLRDFEVPMCGGFLITGYQDELTEYYDIGKEIVCYDTKEELLDKTKYYLAHPSERERIRQAGFLRALSEHTWQKRFESLFNSLGLN
jgi:spore maturation protein CgeB